MNPILLAAPGKPIHIIALGAHADDIEIGAGGTLLHLLKTRPGSTVTWVVFSANGPREAEAQNSANAFLKNAKRSSVHLHHFRDAFFPHEGPPLKEAFEALKKTPQPDLVLTHYRNDLHQDHREVCSLTWNTFRNHNILEYEIPKFDGDLDRPNTYIAIPKPIVTQKIRLLQKHFPTQAKKHWYDEETFRGLLRIRGLECNAPSKYAEAFHANKITLS